MRAIKYPILCQPITHELNCLFITFGYEVLLKNIHIKNIKISALSKYIDFTSINYHIFHIRYSQNFANLSSTARSSYLRTEQLVLFLPNYVIFKYILLTIE